MGVDAEASPRKRNGKLFSYWERLNFMYRSVDVCMLAAIQHCTCGAVCLMPCDREFRC